MSMTQLQTLSVQSLRNLGVFQYFKEKGLEKQIKNSALKYYRCEVGDVLLFQGKPNNKIYLLLEGSVGVFKHGITLSANQYSDYQQKYGGLIRIISKKFYVLGEFSVLKKELPSATVVCLQNSLVTTITPQICRQLKIQNNQTIKIFMQFIRTYLDSGLLLDSQYFFTNTLKLFQHITLRFGDVLCSYGQNPSNIHFVVKGNVHIIGHTKKNMIAKLATLTEGRILGLYELLNGLSHQFQIVVGSQIASFFKLNARDYKQLPQHWKNIFSSSISNYKKDHQTYHNRLKNYIQLFSFKSYNVNTADKRLKDYEINKLVLQYITKDQQRSTRLDQIMRLQRQNRKINLKKQSKRRIKKKIHQEVDAQMQNMIRLKKNESTYSKKKAFSLPILRPIKNKNVREPDKQDRKFKKLIILKNS